MALRHIPIDQGKSHMILQVYWLKSSYWPIRNLHTMSGFEFPSLDILFISFRCMPAVCKRVAGEFSEKAIRYHQLWVARKIKAKAFSRLKWNLFGLFSHFSKRLQLALGSERVNAESDASLVFQHLHARHPVIRPCSHDSDSTVHSLCNPNSEFWQLEYTAKFSLASYYST